MKAADFTTAELRVVRLTMAREKPTSSDVMWSSARDLVWLIDRLQALGIA
ncbi:MAG: hypothetical protein P4L76_00455 [Beijerinckiaceae bacterium]|nr:hypothetical protein [Beijerinckiaceae bacterium]